MLLPTLCLLTLMADPPTLAGTTDTTIQRIPFDATQWNLEWSDEFDGGPAPDPANWTYEEGYVRNNEAQYYTVDRRENARLENGKLVIEARKDDWNGKPITSASLTTQGKRQFLYGRLEAKLRVPPGKGTWPAFWTLGTNIPEVGWPQCGELDIMEYVGFDPNRLYANVHVGAYNHMKGNGRGGNVELVTPYAKFYTYAVEWYPDRLEFFIDDQRVLVFENENKTDAEWPFDKPQYVIVNLAIGGAWGGAQGIDDAIFPARYEVDYVRYYTRKNTLG